MTSSIMQDQMRRGTPGGAALAPPSPFLGILPPEMWDRPKRFFVQPLSFLNLIAGEVRGVPFRADTNHDFVAFYATYFARSVDNLTVVVSPPLLVDMSLEGGFSFNPAGAPVDIENVFGTAKQPSVWAVPLIIPRGTGFTMSLTNLHNATAFNIRVALAGFQVAAALT